MSHQSAAREKTESAASRNFPARLRLYGRPAAGVLLAAVAALAIGIFAQAEHETLAMTEGRFLALEAFLVLAAVGWLSRGFLPPLVAGAAVFAAIALPSNPTRSATLLLILVAGYLLAAAPLVRRRAVTPAEYFFAALGIQALARPQLLLGPWGPRSAALVVMPALAALALHFLARRFGSERALLGFGMVALLAPGLNVNATLLLLAAAAGVYAGEETSWRPARWAAAAFLILPLVLRWPFGLLASAAGLALLAEGLAAGRRAAGQPGRRWWLAPELPAAVAVAVAVVAAVAMAGGRPGGSIDAFLLSAALVPAAAAARVDDRRRVNAGLLLAFAAAWLPAEPELWAAGVLLLALAVPVERAVGAAQRTYSLVVLAGGLLLAGFPWLRPEPLLELAHRIAAPEWSVLVFVLAALALVLLPGLAIERLAATRAWPPRVALTWPPALVLIGIVAGFLMLVPPAGRSLLGGQPRSLAESQPSLRFEVASFPFRQVIVDSQLFHGADLALGQEVAALRLLGKDGTELGVLALRAGEDTADWAAAREDARRRPDFRAPDPWLSQVAPEGTYFSGRFRRRFELPAPVDATAIELVRAAGLPAATQVALHELELRP